MIKWSNRNSTKLRGKQFEMRKHDLVIKDWFSWPSSLKIILFSPLGHSRTCIESHNIYWHKHITDRIGTSSYDVLLVCVSTLSRITKRKYQISTNCRYNAKMIAKRDSWGEGRFNSGSVCKQTREVWRICKISVVSNWVFTVHVQLSVKIVKSVSGCLVNWNPGFNFQGTTLVTYSVVVFRTTSQITDHM